LPDAAEPIVPDHGLYNVRYVCVGGDGL